MSKRTPKGLQIDAINRYSPFVQTSFDLARQDAFVTGLGIDYVHYKCMPSPIGQKDRGDYRRNDGIDTITSNGFIYRCAGVFTGAPTDNARAQKNGDIGTLDPSESMLVMPRFYNKTATGDDTADSEKRIYLAPGDRLYSADPDADVKVSHHEKLDYEPGVIHVPMFPIICLEEPIIDSLNQQYTQGVDFKVTSEGSIEWLPTGRNPGIDPDTGKGRIFSIRYLYRSFWYVTRIPKEIRMTNVTTNGVRKPERMPSFAVITREYMFHNQNKPDQTTQLKPKDPKRAQKAPAESINPNKFVIPVDMSSIGEDDDNGEQS